MTVPKNTYVGRRYIPKLFQNPNDNSATWTSSVPHESLTIVMWQGASYTSKQDVPVGIDINDTRYWTRTADYNAQISIYEQNVRDYHQYVIDQIGLVNDSFEDFTTSQTTSFNTFKDGVNTDVANFKNTVNSDISDFTDNVNSELNGFKMFNPLDDLLTFLNGNASIMLPSGTFTFSSSLASTILRNKRIKGYGKGQTIIKFDGNFNCFDFTDFGETSRFELSDVTIEVDTTNTNSVFYVFGNTSYIKNIKLQNIEIRCPNKAIGQYTGITFKATNHQGIYKNEAKEIEIYYPKNGVVLRSEATNSGLNYGWITFNLFTDIYVEGYGNYGIAIDDDVTANVQTSDNHFVNARIEDYQNPASVRTALKLGGSWNVFTNLTLFNDGIAGLNYALELVAPYSHFGGKFNYITGGHLEGLIKNKQYLYNQYINSYIVERDNANDTSTLQEKLDFSPTNLDVTYYVMNGGNDDNNGLVNDVNNALASVNGVLKKLPKRIDNNIIIKYADGTYAESVYLVGYTGSGSLTIRGNTTTPANVNVNSISAYQNSIKVSIQGINATTTSGDAFTALYTPLDISSCSATATSGSYSGVMANYGAVVHVAACTFSNKLNAISSKYGSTVTSEVNSGTGNTNALNASYGGTICKAGGQPSGTTAEATSYGGVIR